MTPTELHQTIAKLRRDMPRNTTAMTLCDGCEALMTAQHKPAVKQKLSRAEIQKRYRLRKKAAVK